LLTQRSTQTGHISGGQRMGTLLTIFVADAQLCRNGMQSDCKECWTCTKNIIIGHDQRALNWTANRMC